MRFDCVITRSDVEPHQWSYEVSVDGDMRFGGGPYSLDEAMRLAQLSVEMLARQEDGAVPTEVLSGDTEPLPQSERITERAIPVVGNDLPAVSGEFETKGD